MIESLDCPGVEFYGFGQDLLNSGHRLRLRVRGASMFPFIRTGDEVEVAPISMQEVQIGDVVFFRTGPRLYAHRVVRRTCNEQGISLVTKGDNVAWEDGPIDGESSLLGRVEIVYRGGRVIQLNQSFSGLVGRHAAHNRLVRHLVRWTVLIWYYGRRRFRAWMKGLVWTLESLVRS